MAPKCMGGSDNSSFSYRPWIPLHISKALYYNNQYLSSGHITKLNYLTTRKTKVISINCGKGKPSIICLTWYDQRFLRYSDSKNLQKLYVQL